MIPIEVKGRFAEAGAVPIGGNAMSLSQPFPPTGRGSLQTERSSAVAGRFELSQSEAPIYVVDDEATFRNELVDAVRRLSHTCDAFESGVLFLESAGQLSPGIVVLDNRMPVKDGIEVLLDIGARGLDHQIIMLSGVGTIATAVSAMHAGAVTFLEKPFSFAELSDAVAAADARLQALSTARRQSSAAADRVAKLAPRERSILEGIVSGKQNKTMAHELGLSIRTIEMYRRTMFKKLGISSVAAATKLLMELQ